MRKYLEALASAVARRLTNRKGVAVSSFLVFSLLFLTGSPVLSASSASRARAVSAAPLALASGPVGRIGTETRGETENPGKTPPKSLASPGSPNAKAGAAPQIAVAAAIGGADLGGDVASEGRVDRGLCFAAYKVKKGDTLSGIADSFNISLDTVVSFNRIKNARALQPGKILKIPSMSGILYVAKAGDSAAKVAAANGISGDRVIEANALESDQLEPGRSVFLPDAKLASFTLREISGDLFAWPARGWITSWYGWRSDPFTGARVFHNGLDIGVDTGTPVRAAMDGTVAETGYNSSFGNYILISHHAGWMSLYGHLQSISVKAGQRVAAGARIAYSGNTGYSTGPHLHFSVFKYGQTVNPNNVLH